VSERQGRAVCTNHGRINRWEEYRCRLGSACVVWCVVGVVQPAGLVQRVAVMRNAVVFANPGRE